MRWLSAADIGIGEESIYNNTDHIDIVYMT